MIVRTDGEDSILIDFCSFTRGREAIRPPYNQNLYGLTEPGTRTGIAGNQIGT